MKLNIGETFVLSAGAILWNKYPDGYQSDGQSYKHFNSGNTFVVVGEQNWAGRLFNYVMNDSGETFVALGDYLSPRVRVMR